MGGGIGLLTALTISYSTAYHERHWGRVARWLFALVGASFVCSLAMQPYTSDRPKRFYMQHIKRSVRGADGSVEHDAGIWLNSFDHVAFAPLESVDLGYDLSAGPTPCAGLVRRCCRPSPVPEYTPCNIR